MAQKKTKPEPLQIAPSNAGEDAKQAEAPKDAVALEPGEFKKTHVAVPTAPLPATNVGSKPAPPEEDRYGFRMPELIAIQDSQLAALEMVLDSVEMLNLRKWCAQRNKATDGAQWPRGVHEVPRGYELFNRLLARGLFLLEREQ